MSREGSMARPKREKGEIVVKLELQARAYTQRAEQRQQKQENMQPVSPPGRFDDYNSDLLAFWIIELVFLRREGIIRHELAKSSGSNLWTAAPCRA